MTRQASIFSVHIRKTGERDVTVPWSCVRQYKTCHSRSSPSFCFPPGLQTQPVKCAPCAFFRYLQSCSKSIYNRVPLARDPACLVLEGASQILKWLRSAV